jgi:acyl carrier protein
LSSAIRMKETNAVAAKVLEYNMNNIEETIKKIMAKSFLVKLDKITDDAHLINDLGADSLGVFEMVINLEDEFGIEFTNKEMLKFETVGEAVKVLSQLIEKEKS